jgi:hypothetical protein
MEASEAAAVEEPLTGADAEGEVASSVFDGTVDDHKPLGADQQGNVTPASAPPPQALSGDPLDPATKQANDPDRPNPAQGESAPPGLPD